MCSFFLWVENTVLVKRLPDTPHTHLGAVLLEEEAYNDRDVERERPLLLAGLFQGQLVRLRFRVVFPLGRHFRRTGLISWR